MKALRIGAFTLAALASVGIFARAANAQQAVVKDAHFTLPFAAFWEDTLLRPGDYSLSVARVSNGRDALYRVTFAGDGKKTSILAVRPPGPQVDKESMLVAVRNGGEFSIRAMHLPKADLVLIFPAPRNEKTLLGRVPELIQNVPIQIATR